MKIGRVIGSVVSTVKDEKMVGLKLLIVKRVDLKGEIVKGDKPGDIIISVDAVGAGTGEVVLYATGSSARQTDLTKSKPADATIMAIVDSLEVEGEFTYLKEGLDLEIAKTGD
jgi:ethanolamine utilization protein EutN/carbon dioxide concentrating mechanism protein CcmL